MFVFASLGIVRLRTISALQWHSRVRVGLAPDRSGKIFGGSLPTRLASMAAGRHPAIGLAIGQLRLMGPAFLAFQVILGEEDWGVRLDCGVVSRPFGCEPPFAERGGSLSP